APTVTYPLSLHDALPISVERVGVAVDDQRPPPPPAPEGGDHGRDHRRHDHDHSERTPVLQQAPGVPGTPGVAERRRCGPAAQRAGDKDSLPAEGPRESVRARLVVGPGDRQRRSRGGGTHCSSAAAGVEDRSAPTSGAGSGCGRLTTGMSGAGLMRNGSITAATTWTRVRSSISAVWRTSPNLVSPFVAITIARSGIALSHVAEGSSI